MSETDVRLSRLGKGAKGDSEKISSLLSEVRSRIEQLKKKRPRSLTEEQRSDILMAYHTMQEQDLLDQQRHPERKKRAGNYQATVASMLRYGTKTVAETYRDWMREEKIESYPVPGNRKPKATRVPHTKAVTLAVRNFIRGERLSKRRVTSKNVMDSLVSAGLLSVPDSSKGHSSALRAVQRFLKRHGFRRGHKPGSHTLEESQKLQNRRTAYLQTLIDNESRPPAERLRIVDLDESYVHHHYKRHGDSLYHPDDQNFPREQHKGQRYCFVAAIMGDDPRMGEEERKSPGDFAHLIHESVHIFKSEKDNGKGDYHKNFNGSNFVSWFKSGLLPHLKQPCLIRMDNAAYHFVLPLATPKPYKMKKADLCNQLTEYKVAYNATDTVPTLKLKLTEHIEKNIMPAVIQEAEGAGHKVLRTVPYHSDLQPIELIWAQVKGEVGRLYDASTTMELVKSRLEKAFAKLDKEFHRVRAVYRHVAGLEKQYLLADTEPDEADSDNDTSDGSAQDQADQEGADDSSAVHVAPQSGPVRSVAANIAEIVHVELDTAEALLEVSDSDESDDEDLDLESDAE